MRWLLALMLFFGAVQTQASEANRLYAELHLGMDGVQHSDLEFYPSFGSANVGFFILKNIGIEGFVDGPIAEGSADGFKLDISKAAGVALRFQSPPQRRLQAYILLGYVQFSVEQDESDSRDTRTVVESFEGVRVSVGVQKRLRRIPNTLLGLEYRSYHSDSGIAVDGLSVALRFSVR